MKAVLGVLAIVAALGMLAALIAMAVHSWRSRNFGEGCLMMGCWIPILMVAAGLAFLGVSLFR